MTLMNGSRPSWEVLAAQKQKELFSSIPAEWRVPGDLLPPASQDDVTDWPETSGWLTAQEVSITSLDATTLVGQLTAGKLKSVDVVRAFCKRACAAHQLVNCLSETLFERALAAAEARDEYLAKTGQPVGPLHGLPISLKDNFNLKGRDSTVGIASHIGDPSRIDSTLPQLLEAAGAIVYVKTNVPTAMMIAESVNNVFGRTLNPRNRRTTSGGSSGGESALLVLKGSPLGVGSDIGGSLRIPAACSGIFTIRPSFGRFPGRDCRSGMPGQEAVQSVNGPLARTLSDVIIYSQVVINSQPWLRDPKCLPIPWRKEELPEKLKIGVMWNDSMVIPTPPVARALEEVVTKLRKAGHDVVDWDPKDQPEGTQLLGRMFLADGGKTIRHELQRTGEPWRDEMLDYSAAQELGTSEMWKLHLERTAFQNKYLDRWNAAGLDAILCPTTPYSTTKNGSFRHVGYTGVFNVLDYSAVSFPTGLTVDKAKDTVPPGYTPLSDDCRAIHETYDPELVHGHPISLQLVARRLEEEKVLAMTETILQLLKL
ncbi:hypothetical protein NLU13_7172 [Sarocladium strictum]|uniref:Amidase domain-containing protein n=1 Tax=Sarocladium strictum TaxID=5046 RepID=A0AA39L5K1_SARSR|nr:hypothetical protein NLU13_7172 [Sarocladium strictum]